MSSNQTLNGTSNITIPGSLQLCYIADSFGNNYQAFLDQCKNNITNNDTVWILVSNSNSDQDVNADVLANVSEFETNRVQSFIMVSDLMIRPANDQELNHYVTP
jgi:hypothetical protein